MEAPWKRRKCLYFVVWQPWFLLFTSTEFRNALSISPLEIYFTQWLLSISFQSVGYSVRRLNFSPQGPLLCGKISAISLQIVLQVLVSKYIVLHKSHAIKYWQLCLYVKIQSLSLFELSVCGLSIKWIPMTGRIRKKAFSKNLLYAFEQNTALDTWSLAKMKKKWSFVFCPRDSGPMVLHIAYR